MKTMVAILVVVLALPSLAAFSGPLVNAVGSPDWLSYGGDLRLRQKYLDVNPSKDGEFFFRIRPRAWFAVSPVEEVGAYFRFANEYRYYFLPRGYVHPLRDEIIIDNAYLDVKKPLDLPVSVRLGRQDLIYGEGFVVMDGGPNDGSRSIYSDGVKVSIDLDPTAVDLIAVYNRGDQPIAINEVNDYYQDAQKIGLYGAYLTNHSLIKNFPLEAYYLFKDGKESDYLFKDGKVSDKQLPDNQIHVVGARLAGHPVDNLTTVAEGAVQLGDWGDESHRAWGGYAYGTYQIPNCPMKSALTLGYTYLSGDDPSTDRHEGWDPIFSRWPKWSDLYVYTIATEDGPGWWTNMQILRAAWASQPIDKMTLTLGLNYFLALENPFETTKPTLFAGGSTRGLNPVVNLRYKFNDWLSSQWLLEYLRPGSYYQNTVNSQVFSRCELMINF